MESHHITWKFMQIHLALQAEKEEQNSTLRDPSNFPLLLLLQSKRGDSKSKSSNCSSVIISL